MQQANSVDDPRIHLGVIIILLLSAIMLAFTSSLNKAVTVDEFANLPYGLAYLTGDTDHIVSGIPPLSSALSAVPLLFTEADIDSNDLNNIRTIWQVGIIFQRDNPVHYHQYFYLGRIVSILIYALTCLLTYLYAKDLYGNMAGITALIIAAFSPNLIAYGSLTITDIYLALGVLFTLWSFDRLLHQPNLTHAILVGIGIAASCLFKLSGVLLFFWIPFLFIIMFLVHRTGEDNYYEYSLKTSLWILASIVCGLLFINLFYGFEKSFLQISDIEFLSPAGMVAKKIWPKFLPIPLPHIYLLTLDDQMLESGYSAYLLGEFNRTGFWNYYLVAFLIKLPATTVLLFFLAFLLRPIAERERVLLLTIILSITVFSVLGHKNSGIRYLLFLIPLTAVWISRIAVEKRNYRYLSRRVMTKLLVSGLVINFFTTTLAWPNYLSYFSPVIGGPKYGHKYLLDSNIDLGQGLMELRDFMSEQNIQEIDLAYYGRVRPEIYGIKYRDLVSSNYSNRYVAISANLLWGNTYFINGGSHWPEDRNTYAYFRDYEPLSILRNSIYIYDTENLISSSQ